MASEKAKELAAKQKAEAKAAKLAKKNSNNPSDWSWPRQLRETYRLTKEHDPRLPLYLALIPVGTTLVAVALGLLMQPWWLWLPIGVLGGLTADLYVLTARAKRATYKRYEGQPGSAEVAFGMLNKKKWTYTSAISWNKQMDVMHRVIGPAGIVLVGEGSAPRLRPMLTSEQRKHEQIAYGVPVTIVVMGNGEGLVPLEKLAAYIDKLPKKTDKLQLSEVKSRLRALDAARPKIPIPKGPMPSTKGMARAMRGR
jgi:hypothetical protein